MSPKSIYLFIYFFRLRISVVLSKPNVDIGAFLQSRVKDALGGPFHLYIRAVELAALLGSTFYCQITSCRMPKCRKMTENVEKGLKMSTFFPRPDSPRSGY
jgi:hypothetical protein